MADEEDRSNRFVSEDPAGFVILKVGDKPLPKPQVKMPKLQPKVEEDSDWPEEIDEADMPKITKTIHIYL